MWFRTSAGFFLGCLLSISLMINLSLALPLPKDVELLVGLLFGFLVWAAVIVIYYGFANILKSVLVGILVLVMSSGINAALLLGGIV